MATMINLSISEGEAIRFLVDGNPQSDLPSGIQSKGGTTTKTPDIQVSFSSYFDPLRHLADRLAAKISEIEAQPDEVEITVGVKLTTEAGIVFAKAGADAEMTVKLAWETAGK